MNTLLSYVPELRRLSFHNLNIFDSKQAELHPMVVNHLTDVYLDLTLIIFDTLELLLTNFFHQVQLLRISSSKISTYL